MPKSREPEKMEEMMEALSASLLEDAESAFSLPEAEIDKLLADDQIDAKKAVQKVQEILATARAEVDSQKRTSESYKTVTTKAKGFWTHASIRALKMEDPISFICSCASNIALDAIQAGWSGPPFDPAKLARYLGLRVIPKEDIADARTVPLPEHRLQIEFNPNKPSSRVRFSIAHELGHTLFPDCAEFIRNRLSRHKQVKDDWQLEMLCNLAAAEFLMPVANFPELKDADVSIRRLIDLRKIFEVSMEAVLLRFVRLTWTPCAMFVASRREQSPYQDRYSLDYAVSSRNWGLPIASGTWLPKETHLRECTAIGYTAIGDEAWSSDTGEMHIECVGIAPFPGDKVPRVVGIARPLAEIPTRSAKIIILIGDAAEPRGQERRVVAHVVNDKTPNWGAGFGLAVRKKFPEVQDAFRNYVESTPGALSLGEVFHSDVLNKKLTFFQMVCQHGYGPSPTPRLRYSALKRCLESLGEFATKHRANIHMPRIGIGYGGGSWELIQQLIDETLCARGLQVTVYDLPHRPEISPGAQLGLFDCATD